LKYDLRKNGGDSPSPNTKGSGGKKYLKRKRCVADIFGVVGGGGLVDGGPKKNPTARPNEGEKRGDKGRKNKRK